MRVIIEQNYDELSRWAGRHVVETIKAFQPTADRPFVLGLPTGSSPLGMYAEIVKAVQMVLICKFIEIAQQNH